MTKKRRKTRLNGPALGLAAAVAAVGCADSPGEQYTVVRHFDGQPGTSQPWHGQSLEPVSAPASGMPSSLLGQSVSGHGALEILEPALSWEVSPRRSPEWASWVGAAPALGVVAPSLPVGLPTGDRPDAPVVPTGCGDPEVVACRAEAGALGEDTAFVCFAETGAPLFAGGAADLVGSGACTSDELAALADAYEALTCVRQLLPHELPDSAIVHAFLREDALPSRACANVDASRLSWALDGVELVLQQLDPAGGWLLELDGPATFALDTRWFPHLLCHSYAFESHGHGLWVSWQGDTLVVEVGETAAPRGGASANLDGFVQALMQTEPTCEPISGLL